MAEGDFSVKAIISAETSKFEKGMKTAQKSVDSLSSTINTLQSTVSKVFAFAGISIGINTFVNALKSVDVEASESNKQLKLLSNTVKITGAATWTSTKRMNELAESISKNTNYSVNDIRKMETVLLGFKNITGETFTEASNAITDMATVMGMDLTSAVQTVGKALDDPIKGLDSLRRQGFAFTDEQKKELEQLVKNGKQMQAQKIILDELATTYGGAAKQAADSGKQLENSIKNLKAELGKSWDGSIEPIKKAANVLIERWTEAIKKMNEANDAAKNLKIVLSSAGEKGEVSDAKTLQAAKNVQLQQEYRDLFKFEEIAKKSAKERTKAEQQMYKEMSQIYDVYIQSYQSQGYTYLEAIKKVQEDKKAEWTKGLNDFQMIVEKEKQLEKEREEAEKAASDEEAIARRKALTDAYDETIAKAKEEIRIRRSMGEEISEEAEQIKLLEVMKNAYLKMIEDSNGEMKEEAVRLQQIIDLIKQLTKTEEEATDATEEYTAETKNYLKDALKEWGDFGEAILNVYDEIEEEASSWVDFFVDSFHQFGELGKQAIETIGESLVEGEDAWNDLGVVALETIAKILEALATELAARAAVNAATWNYAGAAVAAAGAAAALAGAGALRAVVSQMKSVADSAAKTDTSLQSVKQTIENINKSTKDFSSFASGFITYQKQLDAATEKLNVGKEEFNKNLSQYTAEYESIRSTYQALFSELYKVLKSDKFSFYQPEEKTKIYRQWLAYKQILDSVDKAYNENVSKITDKLKKLQNVYDEALKVYNEYAADTLKAFKETNEELVTQIDTMNLFLSKVDTGSNIGNLIAENIKNGVLNGVYEARNSLISIGSEMADVLFSQIAEGGTETTFLSQMKKNITETVLKLTVYTESLSEKITSISKKIIDAIYSENTASLQTAKNEMKTLWKETQKDAENALSFINEVFGDIADEIDDTTDDIQSSLEKILETFKSEIGDLGGTLADEIVNGLSEGLTGAEFMQNMKDYIRKMVVQSVVYTESLKAEIEAIGKAISTGITEGFTETGLHEIRRDLSYVFNQANQAIGNIDNLFNTVFSGYASGTENATSGIHLVGEAGPELVRFRGGEQVYNANQTQDMLSGNTVINQNVTFNNLQDTSAYAMMQQFKQYNREMAINGIL